MKTYLTTSKLISGKIGNAVKRFVGPISETSMQLDGYKLKESLTNLTARKSGFAGYYISKKGKDVFIKAHRYKIKDLDYQYLCNEAHILKVISKYKAEATAPKFIDFINKKGLAAIVTQAIPGDTLSTFNPEKKIKYIKQSIDSLFVISESLVNHDRAKLPIRKSFEYLISAPFYFIRTSIKEPTKTLLLIRSVFNFYKNYLLSISLNEKYYISHRDLSDTNILRSDGVNKTIIVDWENAVLTHKLYDLSFIPKLYNNSISDDLLLNLVLKYVSDTKSKKRFLSLSIYNTLQTLSLYPRKHIQYERALSYLLKIHSYYAPKLFNQQIKSKSIPVVRKREVSLFEKVNGAILNIISKFPTVTTINKPIILCYHSVGNSNWRFSVTPVEFEKQIEIIKSKNKFLSLDEALENPNQKGVVISFDDAYSDVYDNARKVIKDNNIKPILFVIGEPNNANRKEMNNELGLMTLDQIKELHNEGWTIGYHTKTHSRPDTLAEDNLVNEIIKGKEELENNLGIKLKYFAYPFGIYNKNIIKKVKEAGFEAALTVDSGYLKTKNLMLVDRIPVEGNISEIQFRALISPLGILFTKLSMSFLKAKSKLNLTKPLIQTPKINISENTIRNLAIGLICTFIMLFSVRGLPGNPSTEEFMSENWREHGPFELSPERGRYALLYVMVENKTVNLTVDLARFSTPDLGYINGKYVSLFAPGVSMLIIPGYLVGKLFDVAQVGSYFVISIFALANFIFIKKISNLLGASEANSYLAAITFLFATPAFAYGVSLYQHHISTFLLLASLWSVIRFSDYKALLIVWFCAALSLSVDYPNFFMFIPLGIYSLAKIIYIQDKTIVIKPLYLFTFITAIIPAVLFFGYNKLAYGNPMQLAGTVTNVRFIDEQGNPLETEEETQESKQIIAEKAQEKRSAVSFFNTRNLLNSFYIHFTSPDRGILYFSPILLVGIIGFLFLYKKGFDKMHMFVSIIGMNVLIYSLWDDPWGGWAFGSRYLIPSYALLSIIVGLVLSRFRNRLLVFVFFLLFVHSAFINTSGALSSNMNPPQVEIASLEAQSGKKELFTYERNLEFINAGNSKSFIFQTFFKDYMHSTTYFYIIYTLLVLICGSFILENFYTLKWQKQQK